MKTLNTLCRFLLITAFIIVAPLHEMAAQKTISYSSLNLNLLNTACNTATTIRQWAGNYPQGAVFRIEYRLQNSASTAVSTLYVSSANVTSATVEPINRNARAIAMGMFSILPTLASNSYYVVVYYGNSSALLFSSAYKAIVPLNDCDTDIEPAIIYNEGGIVATVIPVNSISPEILLPVGFSALTNSLPGAPVTGKTGEVQGSPMPIFAPNPIINNTQLNYYLNDDAMVSLSFFDVQGREIMRPILPTWQGVGAYSLDISCEDLPKGIYFYRLSVNTQAKMGKLVKL